MEHAELQKYWDACLIRAWRKDQKVYDALNAWESITGKKLWHTDQPMLRIPAPRFPWTLGVRVFVADFLPNIGRWLWDKEPEKDVELLRKLQGSKYDTRTSAERSEMLRAYQRERSNFKRNKEKVIFGLEQRLNRNHNTDWNVTKGAVRIHRAR